MHICKGQMQMRRCIVSFEAVNQTFCEKSCDNKRNGAADGVSCFNEKARETFLSNWKPGGVDY